MFRRRALALAAALAVATTVVAPWAAVAADTGGAAGQDAGSVVIPYAGSGEVRFGDGWTIECGGVGAPDGVAVACEGAALTLTAAAFDPDAPARTLVVPLRSGSVETTARFRVVQEPPAAPEIGAPVVPGPFPVGSQALVPLSSLGITCGLCTAPAATIRVAGVSPASAFAGVSGTHLAVRSSHRGDVVVSIEVQDAAGQTTATDLTVGFGGSDAVPVALHVVVPVAEALDLADYAWGDRLRFDCADDPRSPASVAAECSADGAVVVTGAAPGAQFAFRVVDAGGGIARGSITFAAADATAAPVAVSWAQEASLAVVVPAPPADDAAHADDSALAPLARIIQEAPVP